MSVYLLSSLPSALCRYSLDGGNIWTSFIFDTRQMQVHALLTEPGEISSVFTLLGVFTNGSSSAWSIVNIDLKNAFSKNFLVTPGSPSMILLGLLTYIYIYIYLFTYVNTLRSLKDTSKAEPVFYSLPRHNHPNSVLY